MNEYNSYTMIYSNIIYIIYVMKDILMNANYTKQLGKGTALLVAALACEFDCPGSLPYTAVSFNKL